MGVPLDFMPFMGVPLDFMGVPLDFMAFMGVPFMGVLLDFVAFFAAGLPLGVTAFTGEVAWVGAFAPLLFVPVLVTAAVGRFINELGNG